MTKNWKATQNGVCISGETGGSVEDVADFETCKIECEKVGPVVCKSAEWNTSTKKCWFNIVDSSTHTVATCANYVYSEVGKLKFFFILIRVFRKNFFTMLKEISMNLKPEFPTSTQRLTSLSLFESLTIILKKILSFLRSR